MRAFVAALMTTMFSLRDRAEGEKRAWRELFDNYVLGPAERAANTRRRVRPVGSRC